MNQPNKMDIVSVRVDKKLLINSLRALQTNYIYINIDRNNKAQILLSDGNNQIYMRTQN